MEGIDSRLILSLHEGMIHDAKFDYSGKRLSTAGSDGVINVFDLAGMKRASTLTFHKRAIWQLKWAHPKFGDPILASLDCDGAVCISQECPPGTWKQLFRPELESPALCMDWASPEHGLALVVALKNGRIVVLTSQKSDTWATTNVSENLSEIIAISCAPVSIDGVLGAQAPQEFASGHLNGKLKLWTFFPAEGCFKSQTLRQHAGSITSLSFAPTLGVGVQKIAVCTKALELWIWKRDDRFTWSSTQVHPSPGAAICTVSWSQAGIVLAATFSDSSTQFFKEVPGGVWECL